MIYSAKVEGNLAEELVALKGGREFTFKPGLNILYGPNGVGKSVLLGAMAAHCSIKNGGWSRACSWSHLHYTDVDSLPQAYDSLCPAKLKTTIAWNGKPTFYQSARNSDQNRFGHFFSNPDESDDGMTDLRQQILTITEKPSAGQLRQAKLTQMLKSFENIPQLLTKNDTAAALQARSDADPRNLELRQKLYFLSLVEKYADPMMTILLDEPENGLDIPTQVALWHNILPELVRAGYQVIIATQSPLALVPQGEHQITDLIPGFSEHCRRLISLVMQGQPALHYLNEHRNHVFPTTREDHEPKRPIRAAAKPTQRRK